MNPVNVVPSALPYEIAAEAFAAVNTRSENPSTFDDVDRYSVDLYAAIQNAYFQRRALEEYRVRPGE